MMREHTPVQHVHGALPARGTGRFVALAIVSAVVALTAVRVEVLNTRAGGVLRSKEFSSGTGRPVTWRAALWTNEDSWRQTRGPRDEHGAPLTRPLTDTEKAQMERDIEQALANNGLRNVVSTWGLLQYPLVLILLALALSLLCGRGIRRARRVQAGAALGVAVVAAFLMTYRAYFSSLGW